MTEGLETPFSLPGIIEYQDGSIVSKILVKQARGSVTLFAFDAGQELSEHTAPFDAFVQIVDGECEVTICGTRHVLRTGESIVMPAHIPHALRAGSRFKMLLTMIRS